MNRHQFFRQLLHELLDTQSDVRVADSEDDVKGGFPYCWVWVAGKDDYDTNRTERKQPVLDLDGRGTSSGSCEFGVIAKIKVQRQTTTSTAAALFDLITETHASLEYALKYGSATFTLAEPTFDLYVREVRPEFSMMTPPDGEQEGYVQITGFIDYKQSDHITP